MITVQINDSHLEKSIKEKARLVGKTTQEVVENLLRNALPENQSELSYSKLNPQNFGYIIEEENITVSSDEITSVFSDVDNSAEYTKELRKKAWRKQ